MVFICIPCRAVIGKHRQHVSGQQHVDVAAAGPDLREQVEQVAGITGHERDVVPARNLDPSPGGSKHPAAGVDPDDAAGRPDRCKRGREVQAGAAPHIDHGGPRRQGQHFE